MNTTFKNLKNIVADVNNTTVIALIGILKNIETEYAEYPSQALAFRIKATKAKITKYTGYAF